ncbi:hypothetical protein llap_4734 [Limosa lapponica baueri]|uniref:Uncharacterized protein n=1 Tax=Limosa lapponica baueri TaxID=1758121 RepID=A0A2I0UFY4_LIMLA|nr:hypothetical protein llap_4734 [Limosa lapponica baueri]
MPNQAILLTMPVASCTPGSQLIQYRMGITTCFCHSDVAPWQTIPYWLQGAMGLPKGLPDTKGYVLPKCMSEEEETPRQTLPWAGVSLLPLHSRVKELRSG